MPYKDKDDRREYEKKYRRRTRKTKPVGTAREELRSLIWIKYPDILDQEMIPQMDRRVISFYLDGLSSREVAARINLPQSNVMYKIRSVRKFIESL